MSQEVVKYWLVKSEPEVYSIGDLRRDHVTSWDGVRNYQARNFLREMRGKDRVLFYHSVSDPCGIAGLATVVKIAYADRTQFDKKSDYYDPKASPKEPRWFSPDIKYVEEFSELMTLEELRKEPALKNLELLKRGSRLSVQPVRKSEFQIIMKLVNQKTKRRGMT